MRMLVVLGMAMLSMGAAGAQTPDAETDALAKVDMAQKAMVGRADIAALDALSAPELTINAPTGRILSRVQFLEMMRDGRIGAEAFDRTIESVRISGDVGIVMGREVFTPTPQSELGRTYGPTPLDRRYTNIYRRIDGKWRWVARHANVVPRQPAAPLASGPRR